MTVHFFFLLCFKRNLQINDDLSQACWSCSVCCHDYDSSSCPFLRLHLVFWGMFWTQVPCTQYTWDIRWKGNQNRSWIKGVEKNNAETGAEHWGVRELCWVTATTVHKCSCAFCSDRNHRMTKTYHRVAFVDLICFTGSFATVLAAHGHTSYCQAHA